MVVQRRKEQTTKRKYRPYQFPGQEAGERLACWLNGPPDNDWQKWARALSNRINELNMNGNARRDRTARNRIIQLLESLQKIQQIFRDMEASTKWPMPDELLNRLKEPERLAQHILERYSSFSSIKANRPYHDGKQRRFIFGNRAFAWRHQARPTYLIQEFWALRWIEELSDAAVIDRIRRCDICRRFFYAKRADTLYCGQACQQNRYDSPSYKVWRRNYDQDRKEWLGSKVVRGRFQSFAAFRDFQERIRSQHEDRKPSDVSRSV